MILKYESYLKMIKNSVGTKMFRNLYLKLDGKKIDATENGNMSCAFFVSNLLLIWKMISEGHATIKGTIEDMKKNNWRRVLSEDIKPGDVVVWEEKLHNSGRVRPHIGFYIGNKKTISNDDNRGMMKIHHWTYGNKRKIITAYQWQKF